MCYGNDKRRQGGFQQTPRVLMVGKLLSDYQNETRPIRDPNHDHLTNKRTAGNSLEVTDTWILRERKSPGKKVENGLQIAPPLSPPHNTLQGNCGAGETRNHKRIMEIVNEH